jgi:hypothetical protein
MRNLSLADREWLYRIHVDANPRRFTDNLFLQACGIKGDGRSSDGMSRLLSIFQHGEDDAWPEGLAEEREAELRESVFAKWDKDCQTQNIENLLAAYEKMAEAEAYEADIKKCAERIAQHEAPGVPEDDTVRWLRRAGVPVTAENWMQVQFMGNPPVIGEVDGEILASLPDFVRKVYDPGYEPEGFRDEMNNAPSAGWCGEPSHAPADPDEEYEDADED